MTPQTQPPQFETLVYEKPAAGVARISLNRVETRNAQDMTMLYELLDAFDAATLDDDVVVIVLAGMGEHFSSGHDMTGDSGKTWRDFPLRGTVAEFDAPGGEGLYGREREIYLDLTRRLADCAKPTIAEVQGWCIAGGLMLAWPCDLIFASDDARFMDPVINIGMPGVEYFAHAAELGLRKAKEFLFLGEPLTAEEAFQAGMVNRVIARADLTREVMDVASRIAGKPRFALKLIKESVNGFARAAGQDIAMQNAFSMHQLCHIHNKDRFGVIIDPRGLPDALKKRVLERIDHEFSAEQRERIMANLELEKAL